MRRSCSKAYHAVFRIHIDAVLFYKPLCRQRVQLCQRSGLTLFLRHSGVGGTVGQGDDGGIRLLHLLYLGSGQGLGVPVVSSGAAATAGHTAVKASAMAHTALSRRR